MMTRSRARREAALATVADASRRGDARGMMLFDLIDELLVRACGVRAERTLVYY